MLVHTSSKVRRREDLSSRELERQQTLLADARLSSDAGRGPGILFAT